MFRKIEEKVTGTTEDTLLEKLKEIPRKIIKKFPEYQMDTITIGVEVSATLPLSKGTIEVTFKKKE